MSGTFADSVYLYFLIDDFSRADLLDSSVGFGFELRYSIKYVGFNTASQLLADLSDVDSSLLEQLAFSRGYESGKKYGEGVGYDKGQADYIKDILPQKESLAHSQGYSEGLKAGNGIFSDLIPSVIIAPITSVLAIFDFSVFGFNLRGLFVGLFSILVIAFIIRKIV